MALTKVTGTGLGLVSTATIKTASNEEDALLVEQSDGTDVGSLRINNGRFILSGKNSSNPVQIQTHDGNEDIEVDPDGFIKMETAGSERLRIDASGKVGIGTTSPGGKLTIEGTQNSLDSQLKITAAGQVSQYIGGSSAVGLALGHDSASLPIVFKTGVTSGTGVTGSGTERMRILADGKVGIGTTSPGETLTVTGNFNATTGVKSLGVYNNTTGTGANVVVDSAGGFARSTSSLRYKNTINDATHGLTELLKLRPVTYKGNNDGDTLFGGLIAEEVHDAGLIEFVTYNDKKEPDALAYGNMVSLCIKAIKELSAKNDALETKKDALEARIKTLEDA